jgi:hypothetical protein
VINRNKVEFANSLTDSINLSMTPCERYGIVWGCDEDCPVYNANECDIQEENWKLFRKSNNQ